MGQIKHAKIEDIPVSHKCEHEGYEYFRRKFVPFGASDHTHVCVYEIPPMKSAYPYHFHYKTEETFYIISGIGILKTPEGEKKVSAGELLFFPAGESGAHKLTNASETEKLVYIDFEATHELDVAVYPESDKIGIWGMGINQMFPKAAEVDYYEGE